MNIITRKTMALNAADQWKLQYFIDHYANPGGWCQTSSGSSEEIYHKLRALGPDADPDKVDEVIGNTSWTRVPACSECRKRVDVLVRIGDENSLLCIDCVSLAMKLLTEDSK